jgi:predicted transcriptional regulator
MENKQMKLFDSELKIMEILWEQGDIAAIKIVEILKNKIGWKMSTTYTVIKKCIDKGAIRRIEPNFICRALITKEQAREYETTELINKMYNGSADSLLVSIIGKKKLTPEEIAQLKKLLNVNDLK